MAVVTCLPISNPGLFTIPTILYSSLWVSISFSSSLIQEPDKSSPSPVTLFPTLRVIVSPIFFSLSMTESSLSTISLLFVGNLPSFKEIWYPSKVPLS